MMARSMNAPFTGRIQKRKTNPLHHSHLDLQHTAGPYSWVIHVASSLWSAAWPQPEVFGSIDTADATYSAARNSATARVYRRGNQT
jgi:hypothetical protein